MQGNHINRASFLNKRLKKTCSLENQPMYKGHNGVDDADEIGCVSAFALLFWF